MQTAIISHERAKVTDLTNLCTKLDRRFHTEEKRITMALHLTVVTSAAESCSGKIRAVLDTHRYNIASPH